MATLFCSSLFGHACALSLVWKAHWMLRLLLLLMRYRYGEEAFDMRYDGFGFKEIGMVAAGAFYQAQFWEDRLCGRTLRKGLPG